MKNTQNFQWVKTCDLGHKFYYASEKGYKKALERNKCKICNCIKNSKILADKTRGIEKEKNYYFELWKKKYGEEIAIKKQTNRKEKLSIAQKKFLKTDKGKKALEKSGLISKDLINYWITNKGYTIEKAQEKYKEISLKKSNKGEKNGMFGKPSPKKSGNGWKGYYKNIFFSSFKELNYLYFLFKKNIKFEKCDEIQFKIPYVFNNTNRNYFPDFIVNNKYIIEIKPKKLFDSYQNSQKTLYAKKFCEKNNLIFKMKDIKFLSNKKLQKLIESKEVILTETYKQKYKESIQNGKYFRA